MNSCLVWRYTRELHRVYSWTRNTVLGSGQLQVTVSRNSYYWFNTEVSPLLFMDPRQGRNPAFSDSNAEDIIAHFPFRSTSLIPVDDLFMGLTMGRGIAYRQTESRAQVGRGWFTSRTTITSLPKDVLLQIFSFYRFSVLKFRDCSWNWQMLAHVCPRWRQIILASPGHLDLRLTCTERTPVKEMLDVFPAFPITISYQHHAPPLHRTGTPQDWRNIIAALEFRDQACWISLSGLTSYLLERFVVVMQEPFPALTFLELKSNEGSDEMMPVLPGAFLGGSAPRLEYLILRGIPFPTLPMILFSTNDLVSLHLADIPGTGYISPEALATCLSVLPRLTWLIITFKSPTPPCLTGRWPPPQTCPTLPSLIALVFRGVTDYLEDLVSRINTPLLNLIDTQFFDQLTFDTPQLFQLIGRTRKLRSPKRATVSFYHNLVKIVLGPRKATAGPRHFALRISCRGSDRQISSVVHICNQNLSLLSNVERLDIRGDECLPPDWQEDVNSTQWLDILRPFIAVGRLHISERLGPIVVDALQELVGERTTEVLPVLQSLFFEGLLPSVPGVREAIDPFIAARHISGLPIAIRWG
ncbi:hypothetical protein BC827DRAFT_1385343 [Russula dissimulans]|nr:hypothetical protein BC827DRAFT_1385343 [Russula dissimulans]